jgi:hypothetical protein
MISALKKHGLAVWATALLLVTTSLVQAQTGREIMEERDRRHQTVSEVTLSTMTIVNKSGDTKTRRLVVQSVNLEDDASRTLLKYLEPKDIRNVGLLTWQQAGDAEDDQWLYLEASNQTKRIVGGAKKNAFMGTDLAYEDLRPEDMAVHTYTIVGEEELDGHATWLIEAVPSTDAERRDSGYAKRVMWIRKDNYVTVQTVYLDRRDREIKRAAYTDLVNVSGQIWRSNQSVVTTARSGSQTITVVDQREIGVEIPERIFLPQNIDKRSRYR